MKYTNKQRGFTVIELLVTTGIMVLIMGVVFTGYPRFKARSTLSAVARELGLLVREAQVFGLAVKNFQSSGDFPPYGVHISAENLKEIILFADLVPDGDIPGVYDSGLGCGSDSTECVRRFTISGNTKIEKICVIPGGGFGATASTEEICDIPQLNISFRRPDPEAVIVVDDITRRFNGAKIYLRSSREPDEERMVRVWITGQISIQ